MGNIRLVAASFVCLLVICDAYRFLRLKGLLDNFHEYDIIDDNPDLNEDGVMVGFQTPFTMYGDTFDAAKLYDTGFISLAPHLPRLDVSSLSGDPVQIEYPYISANWFPDSAAYSYKMAHRQATFSTPELQHDLDRINVEVNRALGQYPETWISNNALITTWMTSLRTDPDNIDKYQVIVASGADAAGNKDYVLFLYESLDIASDIHPFAFVNGYYTDPGEAKGAAVCSEDGNFQILKTYANYKCGNPGIFLLDVTDGQQCTDTAFGQCDSSSNQNCMIPTNEPVDTCTEGHLCTLNLAETTIEVSLQMKWYQYSEGVAVDYLEYIGSGTDTDPGEDSILQIIPDADCDANTDGLPDAGTPDAFAEFTFTTDVTDGPGKCGVQVNTAEGTVKYAFAVVDPTERDVIKDGVFVTFGTCHYNDFKKKVSADIGFNPPEPPVELPPRSRSVTLSWIDASGVVITTAEIDDKIRAEICYDPGSEFVLNGDPFGVYAVDCSIGNNQDMNNNVSPSTDRSIQVIDNGCVALPSTRAFYFSSSFTVKQPDTMGAVWCIRTGDMDAAKFEVVGGSDDVWMQCTYRFCTLETELRCHQSCGSDAPGRGSRSVKRATEESVQAKLSIRDKQDGENLKPEPTCADGYVHKTTVIATICLLVALMLIVCIIAVMMLLRLKNRKK